MANIEFQGVSPAVLARDYAPLTSVVRSVQFFGGIGDGTSRPLSNFYASLAAAQAVYPSANALTDELDLVAIEKSIAAQGGFWAPSGTYVINNRYIDLTGSGRWAFGVNYKATVIQQLTSNVPVMKVGGGGGLRLEGMTLTYPAQEPSTNTGSTTLTLLNLAAVSAIRGVKCQYGAINFYNDPAGYTFSTTFEDCQSAGWSISSINISNGGGITGNVIKNFYNNNNLSGSPATTGSAAVILSGWSDGIVEQLNIEWLKAPYALQLNNCTNLTINGLHVEGYTATGSFAGVIDVLSSGSTVNISGFTLTGSTFDNSIASAAWVRIADGARLTMRHVYEVNNTVTTGNASIAYSGSAPTAVMYFEQVKQSGAWNTAPNIPASQFPPLKRYNEQRYHWRVGNAHHLSGAAAPTGNTWAVGDTIVNTGATQAGSGISAYIIRGWTCVSAGTPGTWVENHALINDESTYLATVAPTLLASGEANFDPARATQALTYASQRLILSYFTALRTETVSTIAVATNSTAAAATPTLCRLAIWTVDASDNLTALVASTANDTSLFAAANTRYAKAFSASFTKTAGQRYAIGILIVTSAATPTFYGTLPFGGNVSTMASNLFPRRIGQVASQSDLPSTVLAGSVAATSGSFYAELY